MFETTILTGFSPQDYFLRLQVPVGSSKTEVMGAWVTE